MRRPPILGVLIVLIGLILAACASPSGSGEPGASAGGEPSAPAESEGPGQSQTGGGGGPGTADGSVQIEMSGGHQVSDELPFVGDFGYFQQAGVSFLVFTDDSDAAEANGVIITLGQDGSDENNVFQYITEDLVIPAANCEWNITRHDATGAAGSFTCNDVSGFSAIGSGVSGIDVRGSFEASQ